jgi:hypothetical protein
MNKVVAHFVDGRLLKGFTNDFVPARGRFHVTPAEASQGARPQDVSVTDLKALFFVRDFAGNPAHGERNRFDPSKPPGGRKIRVIFADGETMVGTTQGYQPGRQGFFVVPAAPDSNTERCFVLNDATLEVTFL